MSQCSKIIFAPTTKQYRQCRNMANVSGLCRDHTSKDSHLPEGHPLLDPIDPANPRKTEVHLLRLLRATSATLVASDFSDTSAKDRIKLLLQLMDDLG